MDAKNKELIFDQLRNYHLQQLPEKIDDTLVNDLRVEFGETQDRIIGMLISTASGKAPFVDSAEELQVLGEKVDRVVPKGDTKELFKSKISKLGDVMEMAKEFEFKMRT